MGADVGERDWEESTTLPACTDQTAVRRKSMSVRCVTRRRLESDGLQCAELLQGLLVPILVYSVLYNVFSWTEHPVDYNYGSVLLYNMKINPVVSSNHVFRLVVTNPDPSDTVCSFEMLAPTYRELDGIALRRVRKASSCPFVQPPVHVEQFGSQWTDFYRIWYWGISRKSVEKKINFQ